MVFILMSLWLPPLLHAPVQGVIVEGTLGKYGKGLSSAMS